MSPLAQLLRNHKQSARSTAEHAWKASLTNMKGMHANEVLIEHMHWDETARQGSQRLQQSTRVPIHMAAAPPAAAIGSVHRSCLPPCHKAAQLSTLQRAADTVLGSEHCGVQARDHAAQTREDTQETNKNDGSNMQTSTS
jgi:hypothetical protein